MNVRNVVGTRKLSPERAVRTPLFQSERMSCDVCGLSPGQGQGPHALPECDQILLVVEGRGRFSTGGETREVAEQEAVHVPAGTEFSIRNEGEVPLTILVLAAPHPNYVSRRI